MHINPELFLSLTAMLAGVLVTTPSCIVVQDSDDADASTSSSDGMSDATASVSSGASSSTPSSTVSEGSTTTPSSTSATGDVPSDTGVPPGDCCVADADRVGCEVPGVAECVCNEDSFCCEGAWDEFCVEAVDELGCSDVACGLSNPTGPGDPTDEGDPTGSSDPTGPSDPSGDPPECAYSSEPCGGVECCEGLVCVSGVCKSDCTSDWCGDSYQAGDLLCIVSCNAIEQCCTQCNDGSPADCL